MSKTLVIAEPGCTHEGDRATLIRLLETASACGADVFKPQFCSDPDLMCERRHIGTDHPKRAYYRQAYGWLQFPVEWHAEFRDRCHALGMEYACSVFIPQDVATIAPLVDYLKISSFEADDPAMRRAYNAYRRVKKPIVIISRAGGSKEWSPSRIWSGPSRVLHCVSAYPAELDAMNLVCLRPTDTDDGFRDSEFVGLSDHSRHLLTGAVAVGAGAQIIETHFRLDDCDPENPDYAVAFTPTEFAQYVKNIRDAETMLGQGVKRVQDCEQDMLPYRVTS